MDLLGKLHKWIQKFVDFQLCSLSYQSGAVGRDEIRGVGKTDQVYVSPGFTDTSVKEFYKLLCLQVSEKQLYIATCGAESVFLYFPHRICW